MSHNLNEKPGTLFRVHGQSVIGYIQTEVQSTGGCGIILVHRPDDRHHPWVTAWYRLGDKDWGSGNYHDNEADAYGDFFRRAQRDAPKP